jgi:predicted DsbA family dithiol-disulfide isomerase
MIVRVFSDYVCPFCYVGKRRADRLREEFDVEVEYAPFEIHPEVPPEGVPANYLGRGYYEKAWRAVVALAEEEGLDMKPPPVIANSRCALVGAEFALEHGRFDAYHEAVFRAYFCDGRNIGDVAVLADLARDVGLDAEAFVAHVEARKRDVDLSRAFEAGVWGVPTFLIGSRAVVGAQPYAVLRAAVRRALGSDPNPDAASPDS